MMPQSIFNVTSFRIVAPFTLAVTFDDGLVREIDFQPVLAGPLFGPLAELKMFNQVQLDPEVKTLVWPNGADFDPETLHNWPDYVEALATRVREWRQGSVAVCS